MRGSPRATCIGIGALPARLASAFRSSSCSRATSATCCSGRPRRRDGAIALTPRGLARAVGLTLIVPIFAQLVAQLRGRDPRVLFLVYELSFCALTLALLRWHPNARALPWVRAVSRFVLLYYGLWASGRRRCSSRPAPTSVMRCA